MEEAHEGVSSAFYLISEAGSLLLFIAMGLHTPEELAWDLLRN